MRCITFSWLRVGSIRCDEAWAMYQACVKRSKEVCGFKS